MELTGLNNLNIATFNPKAFNTIWMVKWKYFVITPTSFIAPWHLKRGMQAFNDSWVVEGTEG